MYFQNKYFYVKINYLNSLVQFGPHPYTIGVHFLVNMKNCEFFCKSRNSEFCVNLEIREMFVNVENP